MTSTDDDMLETTDSHADNARLRARVAALEAELIEVQSAGQRGRRGCAGARVLAGALAHRPQRVDAQAGSA